MKSFIIKTITINGEDALFKIIHNKSVTKKGIKPDVINKNPLIVEFVLTDNRLKKNILPRDVNIFIPLMMKTQKAILDVDYSLECE